MPSLPPFQYQSSGFSEPGIFVELYLPKKSKFQGVLYDTLTKGFEFDDLRKHFLGRKRKQIRHVLTHHAQWRKYSKKTIDAMQPFYWGYSLYEVDGVFYSKQKGRRTAHATVEERTQVIRFMFVPDLDAVLKRMKGKSLEYRDVLDIVKKYLRVAGHRRGTSGANFTQTSLLESMRELNDPKVDKNMSNGNIPTILNYIEDWFDNVGLFIFGYVIFEICAKLKRLGDADEVDYEEEIWLTSFWNLNVNRVSFIQQPKPRKRTSQ
ncbi:MAG: hypothetical protein QOE77_3783 [Blastocatellia bacterium]|jgi:hypothetical protein|nr:hypothetical protein [Blastocatellia bacterium]